MKFFVAALVLAVFAMAQASVYEHQPQVISSSYWGKYHNGHVLKHGEPLAHSAYAVKHHAPIANYGYGHNSGYGYNSLGYGYAPAVYGHGSLAHHHY